MANIDILGINGKKKKEIEVPASISQVNVNPALVHQAVVREHANKRRGTAATKTRGLVRGGGAKPYRQKGTGRARAGSNRSPLWVGGGTIFGPQPRSYSKKMNRKMRKAAVLSVVRDRIESGALKVIEKLELKAAKTKEFVKILDNLEIKNSVLVIVDKEDHNVVLATRNVKRATLLPVGSLNVRDLLKHKDILVTQQALEMIGGSGENAGSA